MENKRKKVILLILLLGIVIFSSIFILSNNIKESRNLASVKSNERIIEDEAIENNDNELIEEEEIIEEPKTIDILSLGNIIIHDAQLEGAKTESGYDFSPSFEYINDITQDADLTLGILEGAIAGGEPSGFPLFNSPDEVIDNLKNSGVDILNYGNNHIIDKFSEGFKRTIGITKEKGLDVLGIKDDINDKNYLIKEVEGQKIGFISYVYETSRINGSKSINAIRVPSDIVSLINSFNYNQLDDFYNKISAEIQAMKEEGAKFIIFSIHWGEEYNTYADNNQISIAKKLNELGVDVILGGHPHVIQPYEVIKNEAGHETLVIYSQGNSLSNQCTEEDIVPESEDGILVNLTLEIESDNLKLKEYKITPTWVYRELREDGRFYHRIIPVEDAINNREKYNLTDEAYLRVQNSLSRTNSIIKK